MKPFRDYRILNPSPNLYYAQVRSVSGGIRIGSIKLFTKSDDWKYLDNSMGLVSCDSYAEAFETCLKYEREEYTEEQPIVIQQFNSLWLQQKIRLESKRSETVDSEHWNAAIPYE